MEESMKRPRPPKHTLSAWQLLIFAVVVFIATTFVMTFVVSKDTVSGPSMEPGLSTGDRLISLQHKKVRRNDIVVLYAPDEASSAYMEHTGAKNSDLTYVGNGKLFNGDSLVPLKSRELYIKRVIGLPGDTIRSKNDKLYINGKRVKQPYLNKSFMEAAIKRYNIANGTSEKYFTKNFSLKTITASQTAKCPPASTSSWGTTGSSRTTVPRSGSCPPRISSPSSCGGTGPLAVGNSIKQLIPRHAGKCAGGFLSLNHC
ncbi:signal peptidase I [Lacticaseibacillus sharpeae]|uniref:signal peptidase I n=1 Tax=Lacticaseibacillus sharpeae TaxID=1626 RepID=UPI0006CFBA3B